MLPRSLFAGIYYLIKAEDLKHGLEKRKQILLNERWILFLAIAALVLTCLLITRTSTSLSIIGILVATFLIYLCLPYRQTRNIRSKIIHLFPYYRHLRLMHIDKFNSWKPSLNIAYITIFNPPNLIEFENKLKAIRNCFIESGIKFKIIGVVDGIGAYQNSNLAVDITKKYCDIVATGNFQRKRMNLQWMINQSWDMSLINEYNKESTIIHFIDDDTVPGSSRLVNNLTKNFANPKIGGVTTKQYVHKPKYFWQHVMQIFESARNNGSQASLSLFGSVGCMPGRWYCVRGSLITKEFARELATEKISFFGFSKRLRDPGDDRLVTIQVQMNNLYTIMESNAVVYTETPRKYKQLWGMVTRWARSSNIYTVQYTLRMIKKPNCIPTLILYWSNIVLAFWTLYIAGPYFIYCILFGSKTVSLQLSLLIAVSGMSITMCIRQLPLIIAQPRYFKWMSILGFLGIFMQFVQVYGILTFLSSKWTGVRKMGLGEKSSNYIAEKISL